MKKVLFVLSVFILLLAACTMPNSTSEDEPSADDLAMTYVAQTQGAPVVEPTATSTLTPTSTPTATSSVTTVSVSVATNCRTGPDVVYALVLVFQPGATAEVIGKYQAPNYWIIKTPTNDTCWLWGEYATVQGDTSTLAEMAPPPAPVVEEVPTSTPDNGGGGNNPGNVASPIATPGNFSATASCQILDLGGGNKILQGKMDTLSWTPVNGATGYTIYIDGVEFGNVGGLAASFNVNALSEKPNNYGIATRTASGQSKMITIPEPDCP